MSFALAINCMDGRVQQPTLDYLRDKLGVTYIDTVTEAGVVQHLSGDSTPQTESILARAKISVEKHGSKSIAVAAHYDCAGNPISEDQQKSQLAQAVEFLKQTFPACDVIGLWIDSNWQVSQI